MSPEVAPAESRPQRLAAHEAHQRLAHERNSRLAQLTAIEESAPPGSDALLSVQTNAIRRVLTDIEAALSRLATGTYGNCQGCAKAIPVERLEILPYARCCVGCQERAV
ncbi:TraR/DksA family transcriptional regulator [Streptomyces sp. x-80]|uniref:TraR/DksA family transcriptional regulator n=1 Tax=Streptomyces sp. x-80 TaxID=2789282 RepID=UPI00397FDB81